MQFGFPRELRLLTARDFSRVFQNRVRFRYDFLTLRVSPNDLGHPRLGFAISRKHIKKATLRQQLKRIVREEFRLQQHELPAVDIVVLVNVKLEQLEKASIHQCINKLWQKLMRYYAT